MKVEELLASIRRSVDDDIEGLGTSMNTQSRGTLMRGALREMRVNLGNNDPSSTTQDEISTLRERIRAKVAAKEIDLDLALPAPPPPSRSKMPSPVAPYRGDFSNILDVPTRAPAPSSHMRAQVERAQHVPLRSAYVEDATSDVRYQHQAGDSSQWDIAENQPQHGYEGQTYDDSYGGSAQDRYPALQAPLMSAHAEAAAETAFRQLSDSLLSRATGDRSIEDMTRELLRGMIKQWLDTNLPALVEEMVREEIERVARRGR